MASVISDSSEPSESGHSSNGGINQGGETLSTDYMYKKKAKHLKSVGCHEVYRPLICFSLVLTVMLLFRVGFQFGKHHNIYFVPYGN